MWITVPAFDVEGNPRPRRVRLETLLKAVGIGPNELEPGLTVITQAQSEIMAFGELASQIGPDTDEPPDISHMGIALIAISHRLDVAVELFDPIPSGRRADEDDGPEAPRSPGEGAGEGG
jgi:hypothetical protein